MQTENCRSKLRKNHIVPSSLLHKNNKFASDEEKTQLEELATQVNELAAKVNSNIDAMSYEEYVSFHELLKYDIEGINKSIADKQKELDELKIVENPDEEKIAILEAEIAQLTEQKNAYEANSTVIMINSSENYKALINLYIELYNKYN